MTRDWKGIGLLIGIGVAFILLVIGIGMLNSAYKDSQCHIAYTISDYRIFNGTNTKDLYDIADHFIAYNGTTITHIVQEGWYLVKVAPDSIGALYPLLGLRFEPLKVCK
jgi:hypothetical protein